jgi:hypothetical protein
VPFAEAFGWTPRQVADLTIPLMLRIAEEVNYTAAQRERAQPAGAAAREDMVDLTKMTADRAAGELRKYGFG